MVGTLGSTRLLVGRSRAPALGGALLRARVIGVAWYRFRATLGRSWGGYASLVLLVALTGGIGMGSIAAARRTQASFSVFLKSTNPSDLQLTGIYGPNISADLAKLPGVERVGGVR